MTRLNHLWSVSLLSFIVGMLGCAPPPSLASIAPSTGPVAGATAVTITGTGFTRVISVTIGGRDLVGVSVTGATSLTGATPAGTAGAQDVVVSTAAGSATLPGAFTYVDPPTAATVAPATGPTPGGTAITITGTGFTEVQSVTIGGQELTGLAVVDGSTLTGTTPAGKTGAQDVVVNTSFGQATMTGGFTYTAVYPRQFGTPSIDQGAGIAADGSGNIFVSGGTYGSFPGYTNAGGSEMDVFVMQLDRYGVTRWIRQLGGTSSVGGPSYEFSGSAATDASGNVYVAGYTTGSLPGSTSAGDNDAFVMKLDRYGAIQWTQQFGTALADYATAVTTDGDGNVYVAGWTRGSFPGFANPGGSDPYVVKFNASGVRQWTTQLCTAGNDGALRMATDAAGNIFLGGNSDGGSTTYGTNYAFVAKLDLNGVEQWSRLLGPGPGVSNGGASVAPDGRGGVFVAGSTPGAFPGFTSAGLRDLFVVRLDDQGTPVWTRQAGTAADDGVAGIAVDRDANVAIAGSTSGAFTGLTNAGMSDLFVMKFRADGTWLWTRQTGTPAAEQVFGVTGDAAGNVYVTGTTDGVFPGLASAGLTDLFVIKYGPDGSAL